MNSPLPTSASRLPLEKALRLYWQHMIGVAAFPPAFFIGAGVLQAPRLVYAPFFFAVSLLAAWPYFTKKAPYTFWLVAMAVWMTSVAISVTLLGLLSLLGIKAEG